MFTRRAQYAREQVANTTHFSPTHLSWAGFRPVSMGMAENQYCNTKGILRKQSSEIEWRSYNNDGKLWKEKNSSSYSTG